MGRLLCCDQIGVAPCVGAWIETTEIEEVIDRAMVAPCVGAWIETEKSTILG